MMKTLFLKSYLIYTMYFWLGYFHPREDLDTSNPIKNKMMIPL